MIHLYTGDGKGKTTAAIGLAVRAAGRDFRVCFAQFMKGSDTGELHSLRKIPNVKILRSEKNFGFYGSMTDADKQELTKIHNQILDNLIREVEAGACGMIVMDEITYPINWKLLDLQKLERLLKLCGVAVPDRKTDSDSSKTFASEEALDQKGPELVITGRDAAPFLWEQADYVTEMQCRRHPYEKGIQARRGIEF